MMNQPVKTHTPPAPVETTEQAHVLIADDDRILRLLLEELLRKQGYHVKAVTSAEEALEQLSLRDRRFDVILLDRNMSGMDGLDLARRIYETPRLTFTPVIILTGNDAPESINEGIQAGVYHYLTKPMDENMLLSVVASAIRKQRQTRALLLEIQNRSAALHHMDACEFHLQTLAQCESTASFLAACFPQPQKVVSGIMELLTNAVEHGNLGISWPEKQRLLAAGEWQKMVEIRLADPANASKRVHVLYRKKDNAHIVQITDDGPGFDWKKHLETTPPDGSDPHGQGISRAKLTAFDMVTYNEKGNAVIVACRRDGVAVPNAETDDFAW